MMHAKTAVFDESWAVVGTSNLDRQSFRHAYEVNLVVEGGETPPRLLESFDRDLADATEIDQQALAQRGPIERVLDRLASFSLRLI
jgi:cardiolipin synthase